MAFWNGLARWVQIVIVAVIALSVVSLVGNIGGGAANARYEEGFAAGVASVTPPPQPTPELVEVEVPGPTQTIEVTEYVETEVEVVPQVCKDALFAADRVIGDNAEWILDVLSAYTDYPDEDLVDFGRRFEAIVAEGRTEEQEALWDEYTALADECHAS